ncbi:MAG: PLP-dependent aminotransferase family protein, partial [Enterobacteriaceae bacterium]
FSAILSVPLHRESAMWLTIHPESSLPLSRQLYEQIKLKILRGELQAEEKLPSSRALSQELNIARGTVLEAYEQLLAEGYLQARQGSATTVATGIARPDSPLLWQERANGGQGTPEKRAGGISFRSGIPDLTLFPRQEWIKSYQRACNRLPVTALGYCEPGGVPALREAIAAYLFRMRGIRVSARQVMITTGSTQGLQLIARLLYQPGAQIVVEDPAHRGMLEVVVRAGYGVHGIRVDQHGMDSMQLSTFRQSKETPCTLLYCTPSHQYPLGGILPIQRRQALLSFAKEHHCQIVEDDYDSE